MRNGFLALASTVVLLGISGCPVIRNAQAKDCPNNDACETQIKVSDDGPSSCKFEWLDTAFYVKKGAAPRPLRWKLVPNGATGTYEFGSSNGIEPDPKINDQDTDLSPPERPDPQTFTWGVFHSGQAAKPIPIKINIYRTFGGANPPKPELCLAVDQTAASRYAVMLEAN